MMKFKFPKSHNFPSYIKRGAAGGMILLIFAGVFVWLSNPAVAGWFDDSWAFRKAIAIPSHTAAENNVYVTVPAFDATDTTKFQADCGDLRFTKQNGELVPYYVVDCDSTANIHVQFDTLPAGASTYYMYYGNPGVKNGTEAADFATAASGLGSQSAGSEEKSQGPVAYWKFDDGTGTNTQDSSPNNNDGAITGATWQTEDQCISGKCLYFDGTNDVVTVANTVSGIQTVSFWVRPITTSEQFIDLNGSAYIQSSSGTISATGFTSPTIYVDGRVSSTISANKWQYVTVTTGTALSGSAIKIGQISTNYGQAFFDDVKIYPYARSAAQIKADFKSRGTSKGVSVSLGSSSKNLDALSNGLVGYWKMDEASWTNDCTATSVTDSSGNGNSLQSCPSPSGPTGAASGEFGNGGSFDGTEDYLISTSTTIMPMATGTVSFWFKPSGTQSNSQPFIFSHNASASGGGRVYFYTNISGTAASLSLGAGTQIGVTKTITSDGWHHAVGTWDGTTASFYIDSTLSGSATTFGGINSQVTIKIGQQGASQGYFTGTMDEVRVYNRALSPAEVSQLYNWAPGPVGYWNFDEGSSTTANDISGNGRTGTLTTGTVLPYWRPGKFGKSLFFTANTGTGGSRVLYNTAWTPLGTTTGSQLTISMWAKPNTTQTNTTGAHLIRNGTITDENFSLYIGNLSGNAFKLTMGYYDGTAFCGPTTTNAVVPAAQWSHITAVITQGTNVSFYINGIFIQTVSWGCNNSVASTTALNIGTSPNGGNQSYDGYIDDVKIYNYARTSKQIVEDMNAGHPAPGSPVGSQTLYYKFDEGYGGTAYDSGPNKINGAIGNGTWSNSGKFGKTLTFGATTSVTATITDPGYSNTISLWINPTTSAASKTLVTAAKLTTDSSSRLIYGGCTGTALSLSQWTHIVAVSDGSGSCKIYQNGIQTANSTTGITFGTSVNVGASSFTGNIDEVKIYSYPLTADEIKLDYNRGSAQVLGALGDNSSYASGASNQQYCVPGSSDACASPVGEWNFEEKTSTTAVDISGNSNTGTLTGTVNRIIGKIGSAISTNGTNGNYVSVPDADSLDTPSAVTLSIWANPASLNDSSGDSLMCKGTGNGGEVYCLDFTPINSNKPRFYFWQGGTLYRADSPSAISLNTWSHITGTFDGATLKIYVNGILMDTAAGPASLDTNTHLLSIGCRQSGVSTYDRCFNGKIDEARIYNYARTPAQIAWDYNRGGPVGWWKFDECQGTTANDSSGNNNVGTITPGAGTYTSAGTCTGDAGTQMWAAGTTGKFNSSLGFDGADDYVNVGGATSLNFPTVTISLWVKPNGAQNAYDRILEKLYTTSYYLGLDSTGTHFKGIFANSVSPYGTLNSTTTLSSGTWYHVVATHDGTNDVLYVNGVQEATQGNTTSLSNATINVIIGRQSSAAAAYFAGQIDDVRIYNYALTSTQIKTLFNDGSVRFGPITGSP